MSALDASEWLALSPGAYVGFVVPELMQVLGPFCGREYKITNTKLSTKVNVYFWPLTGPWKGPVQVKGPEG